MGRPSIPSEKPGLHNSEELAISSSSLSMVLLGSSSRSEKSCIKRILPRGVRGGIGRGLEEDDDWVAAGSGSGSYNTSGTASSGWRKSKSGVDLRRRRRRFVLVAPERGGPVLGTG